MLSYLGRGSRFYGLHPIPVCRRTAWEFQAVLKGRIGITLPQGASPLQSRRLWISPPGHAHGWTGSGNDEAQVAVFHFVSAPEILRQAVDEKGFLEVPLSTGTVRRLFLLAKSVERYWRHPAAEMMIYYEHALMELSMIFCEANIQLKENTEKSITEKKVDQAIAWYAERVADNPSLPDVAVAVGVSVAHLRRLFGSVLQTSPKHIMDQVRFQRAIQLMSNRSLKLETISEKCGFTSASAFSRAFKGKFGCPPALWRV